VHERQHWCQVQLLKLCNSFNKVEAVQRVHLTNIPVWFGLLGDIKDGRA